MPCPEGTYTNVTATPDVGSCQTCPAGYYCPLASSTPTDCPRGSYCVAGSFKPEPCPIGRYGNTSCKSAVLYDLSELCACLLVVYSCWNMIFVVVLTVLTTLTECPPCDPGWYCDAPGLLQPRAPCDPGYLCYSGASTSAPTDGTTGELCPRGGFCVSGQGQIY